jgi:alpha-methylacyl-CoA racemase
MRKALSGVRVLDLSRLLPGPFAARLLRNQGAAVIRIELPQMPDPMPLFGRGRRLDYTREPGRTKILDLIGKSDVLIEGFRPGLLTKRGLGPKELLKRFPSLIYCSITGGGSKGPRRAGHDLNYQAEAGLLLPPDMPNAPVADLAGANEAALRIVAALLDREKTGRGAFVDVSMTAAAKPFGALSFNRPFERELGRWWAGEDAFYRLYACKDGWLAVGALENSAAVELLRALNLEQLLPLLSDRRRHAPELARTLRRVFAKKTRAGWAAIFSASDACVTPVSGLG